MRNIFVRALLSVVAGVSVLAASTEPADAGVSLSQSEAAFVTKINEFRTARGLGAVMADDELTEVARRWTITMAERHDIQHNADLPRQVRSNWAKLGENVGTGPAVDPIFDAFVNSPTHLRNLEDPAFTRIGVGVVADEHGTLFTAHEFMSLKATKANSTKKSSKKSARRPARRR